MYSTSCSLVRCYRFDLRALGWIEPFTGRPFKGNINERYCNERWDRQGYQERFCEVYCHYDGSCTETVKQKKCSCEDGSRTDVISNCATVEYQVRKINR